VLRHEFQFILRIWPAFPRAVQFPVAKVLHAIDDPLLCVPLLRRFVTVVVSGLYPAAVNCNRNSEIEQCTSLLNQAMPLHSANTFPPHAHRRGNQSQCEQTTRDAHKVDRPAADDGNVARQLPCEDRQDGEAPGGDGRQHDAVMVRCETCDLCAHGFDL
jgi:hypothetical protein